MVLFIDSCYQFLILDPSLITSLFDSSKCFNHPRSLPLRLPNQRKKVALVFGLIVVYSIG
uniref:Uncharacterized protein n=1 Tax=Helianthus annuus TaxID=4232 RepID=A0A251TA05_HELAN